MKKLATLLFAVLLTGQLVMAQSIDDARKAIYYGRVKTAKETLNKMIASNSKNAEAIYWLGQAYLAQDDIAGAKKIYQDALNSVGSDPWILVGMGHVSVLEGNKNDARQRFEVAISTSMNKKKENPAILTAIGRANADGPMNAGDPQYAIDKLKKAIELDPNNADANVYLGINYLKLGPDQGGNAYSAFNEALRIQPNNALAKFRLGKIFQSQGQADKFLQYYTEAVTVDPAYAPGYLELYNYYSNRDVNKAREYLDKYLANTDKDCNTEFFYADYLFRSGKYQESLQKAKEMENGECKSYPRLKVLYAYNYDRLGDSLQARQNIESYLATAPADKVLPTDYEFIGKLMLKFPGEETRATGYLEKAMNADTTATNKGKYVQSVIETLGQRGKYADQVTWYRKLAAANGGNLTNRDLYLFADAAAKAKMFVSADSASRIYIQKYPDQEYGYSLLARVSKAADPDSTKGTAFGAVQTYIDYLRKDSVTNASKIKSQYYYIASVSADKLKDYTRALDAVNAILAIDPNDSFAVQAKPVLQAALKKKSSGAGTKSGGK